MKTIQSVVFVTLCLSFGYCDIPGKLIGFSRFASRAITATCAANSYASICGDCSTVLKCQNANPPLEINCRTAYTDRPYCSNGICTSEPETACVPPFHCTDAGYFPNPLNCSRYHLCGAAGAIGNAVATYECPITFVYNPATTMCKLSASSADCAVVDCTAEPFGFVAYPADKTLYASCFPGTEPEMFRCPLNNVFQPLEYKCAFECPRDGRIADPSDSTKFYECYFNGATYISQSLSCVDGYEFSEQSQQCISKPTPPITG